MKILVFTATIFLLPAVCLASGKIYFNPSWALKTTHGRYIDIVSLSVTESKDGEVLLVYETTSGKNGFLPANNLENDEELIATIKQAKEQRSKLYEKPYKPVRNRRPAASTRRNTQPSGPTSTIVSNCKNKWGEDYRMIDYCIKKQTKAFNSVRQMSGSILRRCREKWGDDYRMIKYCVKKQTEAKRRVDRY